MSERLSHELLNWIDRRIASEQDKTDSLTRGYLMALRHCREKIVREEEQDCLEEKAA